MTTFLKNRDMKFSFHLLLACIALTACGESGDPLAAAMENMNKASSMDMTMS